MTEAGSPPAAGTLETGWGGQQGEDPPHQLLKTPLPTVSGRRRGATPSALLSCFFSPFFTFPTVTQNVLRIL